MVAVSVTVLGVTVVVAVTVSVVGAGVKVRVDVTSTVGVTLAGELVTCVEVSVVVSSTVCVFVCVT